MHDFLSTFTELLYDMEMEGCDEQETRIGRSQLFCVRLKEPQTQVLECSKKKSETLKTKQLQLLLYCLWN